MTVEKKISDIDYCYASWQLLTELEKNAYSRNNRIRVFLEKANARQTIATSAIALILPLILWGFLLLSPNGMKDMFSAVSGSMQNVGMRFVGLLVLSAFVFLVVYMLLKTVWDSRWFRSVKGLVEKDIKTAMLTDINRIDERASKIVNNNVFMNPRVPEEFLSAEIMLILIRYFETGQASFMKEAVYFLKLELQNTGHYTNMIPKETLLQKEKNYLADRETNLEKKIELSELS